MRIRIRCRDNDHKHCNWLKWQSVSRMFEENRWRLIRTRNWQIRLLGGSA